MALISGKIGNPNVLELAHPQETFRILTETYEKDDNRKANIPVPPIVIIEDYDKFVPKNFVKPSSYIRFTRWFPHP